MPRLTIDELRKKREDAKKGIYLRDGAFKGKIAVHMGTCGIAAGARDIMAVLLDEVEKRGIRDIMVTTTGCAGFCSQEPMLTVELLNSAPVKYGNLTPEKTRRILADHIKRGRVVAEYAIGIGSERGG